MSTQGTIRRYTLEIEKVSRGQFPSFKEIMEYLGNHGFEISARTLERDFEQIRFEFGIEITYKREKSGYFIDYEKSIDTESFFRFLEIVNTAELLTESLSQSKNALQYFSFDGGGGLNGIENLKILLKAIKDKRKISFNHFNFHTGKTRKYTLKPYLLKEYQNRWYVVGILGKQDDFITFGIDRMNDLIVLAETFINDEKLNPAKKFENIIGVVHSNENIQKVILSFSPGQGKYIKTLPLHKSQQILIDNETEFQIALDIIPNYEFIQQILKHGDTVKVIEPQTLAKEVKQNLKRTLKKYK